jgi:hypothetical protein
MTEPKLPPSLESLDRDGARVRAFPIDVLTAEATWPEFDQHGGLHQVDQRERD